VTASGDVLLAGVEVGEVSMAFGAVEVVDRLIFDVYVEGWVEEFGFECVIGIVLLVHSTIVVVSAAVVWIIGVWIGGWSEVKVL